MQELLRQKLQAYLADNNPDLLIQLQEENRLTQYLQEKVDAVGEDISRMQGDGAPAYVIEDICMDTMTADLRPSRFNYICDILSEYFEATYYQWKENGILTYEAINLLNACEPLFEAVHFSAESANNPALEKEVKEIIQQYINEK